MKIIAEFGCRTASLVNRQVLPACASPSTTHLTALGPVATLSLLVCDDVVGFVSAGASLL